MRNKFFAKNEVSKYHSTAERIRESDLPESEMMDHHDFSRTTSMMDSRCNSLLGQSEIRQVDPMMQSLCISMDGSQMGD